MKNELAWLSNDQKVSAKLSNGGWREEHNAGRTMARY